MRRSPWSAATIPVARDLLDRTIAEARNAECWVVVSKGLTDRARVAAIQGDLELSLECSHEALELSTDPLGRERILANIALTFAQMGLREAARDAGLLVAATAQDRTTRLSRDDQSDGAGAPRRARARVRAVPS